jgi:glycosyltransferase involved in cell wall biosynthesis
VTAALKVAFDMTFPNRNPAGSGVYAKELLDELTRRDDVTITAVAAREGGGFARTMAWLAGGARAAVGGSRLVHCPAFVAPWRLGAPLILTVHDTSTQRFAQDHPLEWRMYTRLFLPERARAAARVITGTEFTKSEIARDLGVREDRIAVTPYGVSERFARARRPQPTPGAPPLLLFPGAPTKRKNLEVVLATMAEAPERTALRRARLAISGASADQFPEHRARIESTGLSGRVEWRGKVPAEAMPDLVASADLLVYPSLYEGFGFPALEAMLAGTPVVASNAGCLPEVLGDAALLVDPNDVKAFLSAAETVLTNENVRRDLIGKGRTRVARYSWKRCADLTVDVYRQALGARHHG